MPEVPTGKHAAAQRKVDATRHANAAQSYWLVALCAELKCIQDNALARTDGRIVSGLFEVIAQDTATQMPFLGDAALRLSRFVGELAGDTVQGMMDVWSAGVVDEANLGASEISETQVAFLDRGRVLRSNRNWVSKARRLGFFSKKQEARATSYEDTLSAILLNADVLQQEFRARLIAAAQRGDFLNDPRTYFHRAEQYTLYVSVLGEANRRHKALGELADHADKAIIERINTGEILFAVVEGEIVQFTAV